MQTPALQTSERSPLRELLAVAGPTVATMTSYTVMNFTDKWIVSRLGPEYVGAQGNGGVAAWVPQSFVIGMLGVVNTFVSQNIGAGRPERAAAYAWNAVWIGLASWLLVLIPISFALPELFRLAHVDPRQAELGAQFGQILLWGCCFNITCRAIGNFFYGLHKAGVVMVAGIAANILNLVVSATLVYGNGPLPEGLGWFGRFVGGLATALHIEPMGMKGSAYGTVIATFFEMLIPLCLFLGPRYNARYRTRAAWRFSVGHVKDLARVGWPAGLMFGNEMICWSFFMVYLVSHFGEAHASAGWIAHQYMSLSFMPTVGISVAVTAIVGKYIGMGRPEIAAKRAWLGMKLAVVYMGLCGVCFVVFRGQLVRFFIEPGTSSADADELVRLGSMMLIATACFQLFDGAAMVMSGALRGAGDTVFPGVATVIASWSIIVVGGFAMIHAFPGLESIGAWIAAATYIFALCILLVSRFASGRWKSIKLLERSSAAAPPPPPPDAAAMTTDGIV